MSYHQPASYNTDYNHETRWHDPNVGHGHHHPSYPPAPFWRAPASSVPPPDQSKHYYHNNSNNNNATPGNWHPSPMIVNNELVWTSNQYGSAEQHHAYASREPHFRQGHDEQYTVNSSGYYDLRADTTEIYGHHGEVVASPIEDHQHSYGVDERYTPEEHSTYPTRGWTDDSHTSSEEMMTTTTTDGRDEYRASIARHCDEIHASGSHGLESDNHATPHFHSYHRRSMAHEEEEEDEDGGGPEHHDAHNKWYDGIAQHIPSVHQSHQSHVSSSPMTTKAEQLMEPPMRVPSQQHLVEYMHEPTTVIQSPHSPVTRYHQPVQPSSPRTNRQPSTPTSPPPTSPYTQQRDLVPTPAATLLSSGKRLKHEDTDVILLNGCMEQQQQQQPSIPNPYPGSSQSVLKLTTTKKVAEKKQALACLFCRERKIACGRPDPENEDQTCNQCARRHIHCEYPKESRRGQHKRTRRKKTHDHDVNDSSPLSAGGGH